LPCRLNQSTTADFAIINAGGIRASIDVGPITRGEILTSFPFGNSIVEIQVTGDELWKNLEGVFSKSNQFNQRPVTSAIQVSKGINITYNSNNPAGTKLVAIQIGAEALDMTETYNIVTLDFLAGGKYEISLIMVSLLKMFRWR
jgi:5'-nucleotidase